ncbi:MAG TPA: SAM-dependent chlorinase/fluorinase [Nitrospirae bacterium]|nr:SAM-dependent chlorinase/fluorinase [Nitrospirota bacterium]
MKKPVAQLKPSGIITLTTDFGYHDTFIGQMKGVILSINKKAKIIDITHHITPFCIDEASNAVSSFYKYYPEGTIHLVIVDPGVGYDREGVLIKWQNQFFIGPDNGVFTSILMKAPAETIIALTNRKYFNPKISNTFHGRDIFAPVSAWLSKGISIFEFGKPLDNLAKLNIELPNKSCDMIIGHIQHIDNFGNLFTNIDEELLKDRNFVIIINNKEIKPVSTYKEAKNKGISCLINSSGYLELFFYEGNCANLTKLKKGDTISVRLK